MESEWPSGGFSYESDLSFAFNNRKFSDTVLRIEIITNPVDAPANSDTATTTIVDCKKRRRGHDDEAANKYDVRVETLYISSHILATKSIFFNELFSNGMSESEQRHFTLRINASEETGLMELLKFMYCNTLNNTATPALLDLLMTADKFQVSSCMRYCSQLLLNSPMTLDSALLYLELPRTVLKAYPVQPLAAAAKQYLVGLYKDITKFKEEVMALPLSGIEAILASDDLQVESEDDVYDFVFKWARQHYHKQKERQEVIGTRLMRLIRFPYMSCQKLEKVLTCYDFTHEGAPMLVLEALFIKAQQSLTPHASSNSRFVERAAYKYRPVKVVEFELPQQQCVVYLDLKREECATLFPSGRVKSQTFHLGGQMFFLLGVCNMNKQHTFHCFELVVGMRKKGSGSFVVDCEFATRSRPAEEEFVRKHKSNYTFTGGELVRCGNLFGVPWSEFMAEDSPFFINDVLYLRAEFTIRQ